MSLELQSQHSTSIEAHAPATTLAVYGIPAFYTQDMLVKEWPLGSYDFLHLRRGIATPGNDKMAIINFVTAELAATFRASWHGRHLQKSTDTLSAAVFDVQGQEANLMLVLDGAEEAPLLLVGRRALGGNDARELVRLAKRRMFVRHI